MYDEAAKARFLDTITGAVGGVKSADIKERAIQYWTNVDADLGAKLRANLGAGQAPPTQKQPTSSKRFGFTRITPSRFVRGGVIFFPHSIVRSWLPVQRRP